jgi:hypothetical protein
MNMVRNSAFVAVRYDAKEPVRLLDNEIQSLVGWGAGMDWGALYCRNGVRELVFIMPLNEARASTKLIRKRLGAASPRYAGYNVRACVR